MVKSDKFNKIFAFVMALVLVIASVIGYLVWAGDVDYTQYGTVPSKKKVIEASTRQIQMLDGSYRTAYRTAGEQEMYVSTSYKNTTVYYINEDMTLDKVYFDIDSTQSRYVYDINSIPINENYLDDSFDYTKYKVGDVLTRRKNHTGNNHTGTITVVVSSEYIQDVDDTNDNIFAFVPISHLKQYQNSVNYYKGLKTKIDITKLTTMPLTYTKGAYAISDSVMKEIKATVESVTKGCTTYREKAHALYVWGQQNIKYDHSQIDTNSPEKAWVNKGAVCGGFARLYQVMCVYAGVPCLFVASKELDHAWNAVYLDGVWRSVDVSSASCTMIGKNKQYEYGDASFGGLAYNSDVTNNYSDFKEQEDEKEETIKKGGMTYTTLTKGTVELTSVKSAGKTVIVPDSIKKGGKTYKVTAIEGNICSSKTTKVVVGANVTKLWSGVFAGKNVKTIVIKSKKLKSIQMSVFKGCGKKGATVTVTVPKSKYKEYAKWIKIYSKNHSKAKFVIKKS